MHIVLAVISALGGLAWALVALQRSGFNPDSINPFLWLRRTRWRRRYNTHPLLSLQDPMDVAAVLILGTAKCEGDISKEQKQAIQEIFEQEFRLDHDRAADLLLASAHLIRDEVYLLDKLDKILAPAGNNFSIAQATSLLSLMTRVGTLESALNEEQRKLITATGKYFEQRFARQPAWRPDTPTH